VTLYDTIKNMPMFRHFSAAQIKSFAEMEIGLKQFEKNDVIINEGDQLTSLYLLIEGTILITKTGYQTPISRLTPGAVFGEMSFLTKKPRYSNVIANERVRVMKMDDDFFKVVSVEIKDKIKDYLIELLINRLDTMNESLSKIAKYTRNYSIK
jgi:CRP/FNR family cyclic AMP-dependent transcriptional regulator